MNLRYINIGAADPVYSTSCWEIITQNIEVPTVIISELNTQSLIITNNTNNFQDFISVVPKDLIISKLQTSATCDFLTGNVVLANTNSIIFSFHVPNTMISMFRSIALSFGKYFRNVSLPFFANSNFTEYMIGDKKIGGIISRNYGSWTVFGGVILYNNDYTIFDKIINPKFFNEKMIGLQQSTVNSSSELLTCMDEQSINVKAMIQSCIDNFCNLNNLTLVNDTLTNDEISFLTNLSNSLRDNHDWIYNNIHP